MILDDVKELVAENLGCEIEDLTENTNLIDDLNADSLDIVELTMAIEDKFGVQIPDEDLEKVRTVSDIVKYVGK
ncbi:acyl carrier protein [Anaerosphaera aminiphila DSM 21120]|uniref:Acyl carrier protein n=1 Tax=Anaerosphaera aminiphila DSM 21120 TaxID=1120995 RepID=A0A1M5U1T6_9FIRM|nr:acyl carrier protein [Anaerosphaera aminiphila]SHH56997.1 acyl carrier protein [Anaerosphaera aminiphila DSM 21120]